MKKNSTFHTATIPPAQNSVDFSSAIKPDIACMAVTQVLPPRPIVHNRQAVETRKAQIISDNLSTSDIEVEDFGNVNYKQKSSASQVGLNRFQETRLLSPAVMRHRVIEAMKRDEQKRRELLAQEADPEDK